MFVNCVSFGILKFDTLEPNSPLTHTPRNQIGPKNFFGRSWAQTPKMEPQKAIPSHPQFAPVWLLLQSNLCCTTDKETLDQPNWCDNTTTQVLFKQLTQIQLKDRQSTTQALRQFQAINRNLQSKIHHHLPFFL